MFLREGQAASTGLLATASTAAATAESLASAIADVRNLDASTTARIGNLDASTTVRIDALGDTVSANRLLQAQLSTTQAAMQRTVSQLQSTLTATLNCQQQGEFYNQSTERCAKVENPTFVPAAGLGACTATLEGKSRRNESAIELCINVQNSTSPAYEWSAIDAQPDSVYGEPDDPAISCKRILEERPDVPSGVFTLASSGTPFQVYCDMESFGGGWTMVYSTGDDSSGNNNFQLGIGIGQNRNAPIHTMAPGNANKRFARDVFNHLDGGGGTAYTQVMMSGFPNRNMATSDPSPANANFIKWTFSRSRTRNNGFPDFTQFINHGIGRHIRTSCNSGGFSGTEQQQNQAFQISWEDRAIVVGGRMTSGCGWSREVWNEIDAQGGHLLPVNLWSRAESYSRRNRANGYVGNQAYYHMWVR